MRVGAPRSEQGGDLPAYGRPQVNTLLAANVRPRWPCLGREAAA
jgi:hypothetical protein